MKKILVTTSWDDGHKLDIRLAKLLKKYSLKGTFYISPKNREFNKNDLLTDQDIKTISKDFEIGAHTMTHPHLSKISPSEAHYEIKNSKRYLEKLLEKNITSFSYPYGGYDDNVKTIVGKADFLIARSTRDFITDIPTDAFSVGTTYEFCPQTPAGIYGQYKKVLFNKNHSLLSCLTLNWEQNAKNIFDYVSLHNGVYHLWGHSHIIEKYKLWNKLENLFQYISSKENISYLNNIDVVRESGSTKKYEFLKNSSAEPNVLL